MKSPWLISLEIYGAKFTPSRIAIPFSRCHDQGVIGQRGRYRDQPLPYGSASYVVPDSVPRNEAFEHLVSVFESKLEELESLGATEWHVSIGRYYYVQCNEDYSMEELSLLLRLRCGFTYSAYTISEEEELAFDNTESK